jgi:hypothetical protein
MRLAISIVAGLMLLAAPGCSPRSSTAPNTAAVSAAAPGQPVTDTDVTFRLMTETVSAGSTSVFNGVPVTPSDWPALVVAPISQVQSDGTVAAWVCTATLVGPRVLLTAAHCVDGGAGKPLKTIKLKVGGLVISTQCAMSPSYAAAPFPVVPTPRNSADFALCLLDTGLDQIAAFQTLQYEVVERKTSLKIGDPILVTGYGCTSITLDQNGRPIFGPVSDKLRAGDGTVSHAAGTAAELDYVQVHSQGPAQAALCPGDSGGPLIIGATLQHQTGARRVAGTNSSIAVAGPQDMTSRFASLATDDFRAFSDQWLIASGKPVICGINLPAGSFPCRT